MGRRRPRLASDFHRRRPTKDPYEVALIVCEGEKTEPAYFEGLRRAYRLSNANIRIVPADGNDPVSVVRYAVAEYNKTQMEYDRVYCVFDRDGHANYSAALNLAANSRLGKRGILAAIHSVPCFEVWVLLHFAYSTASFTFSGGRSACENVIAAIRAHLPEYEKAFGGVFEKILPLLDGAIRHAEQLALHNRQTGSDNPATNVHDLVKYLRSLRRNMGEN